jgi:hypothetical protein
MGENKRTLCPWKVRADVRHKDTPVFEKACKKELGTMIELTKEEYLELISDPLKEKRG